MSLCVGVRENAQQLRVGAIVSRTEKKLIVSGGVPNKAVAILLNRMHSVEQSDAGYILIVKVPAPHTSNMEAAKVQCSSRDIQSLIAKKEAAHGQG
jgi:hypothetical protein